MAEINNRLNIINKLKANKNFEYLVMQKLDNITIGNAPSRCKGLGSIYPIAKDTVINYIINMLLKDYNLGPIDSKTEELTSEQEDDVVRAAINNLFLIVCIDKLISKYKDKPVRGFSTEHTHNDALAEFQDIKFDLIDEDTKEVLKVFIEIQYPDNVKKQSVKEFRTQAAIKVSLLNIDLETVGKDLGLIDVIPDMINTLIWGRNRN